MAEKRERIAAQEQATLEREIAVEELRLQRLRIRKETERLEGPFNSLARKTTKEKRCRGCWVAAGTAATGAEGSWDC